LEQKELSHDLEKLVGRTIGCATVAILVTSCGGKTSGGGGLPTEPEKEFACHGQINVPNGQPLPLPSVGNGVPPLDVCDLANQTSDILVAHCENKCGSILTEYGQATNINTTGFTCSVDMPIPLSEDCPNTDPPGISEPPITGGPAQFVASLTGNTHLNVSDQVCALICISDSVSADSATSAQLAYTIVPTNRVCPPQGCQLLVTALNLNVNDFDIGGLSILGIDFVSPTHVSGMQIGNVGWITGTWQPNGRFTIPANTGRVVVTAAENGTHTSFDTFNSQDITGTIDPVSGAVSFDSFSQGQDDTTITIGLSGANTTHPPVAAFTVPPTIECNQARGAAVTLDGTASSDPDNDIKFFQWIVNGGAPLFGAKTPATLVLGTNDVMLNVFDSTLAVGTADETVRVVDTTPPAFPPLTSVLNTLCDPSTQTATLAVPVATDVCSPTPPSVTGAITSINGRVLATPIPLSQNGSTASITVAAGIYVVTWSSTDPSGNIGTTTQTLTVRPAIEASDAIAIDDRAILTLPGGAFAQIGNTGTGVSNIGVHSQTGNLLTEGSVFLRNNAIVHGNVLAAGAFTAQAGASVTGTTTQHTTVPLPAGANLNGIVFPTTNAGPVGLEPGATRTITPGSYGDVAVKTNAKLTISTGTYFFTSLDLEPGSKLNLDQANGPVLLYVHNSIIDRGQIASFSGAPGGFVLGYAGTSTFFVQSPFLAGTVIAPNADVVIASLGAAAFRGELFAKDIEVQPDAVFACDPIGKSGTQSGLTPLSVGPSVSLDDFTRGPAEPTVQPSSAENTGGCNAGGHGPAPFEVIALAGLVGMAALLRRRDKQDRAHRAR
jgi:uncharacterized protein (TIGR03382 family)